MFTFRKPDADRLQKFREAQRGLPFSYPEVGQTRGTPPSGYHVAHTRVRLGTGAGTFARARRALAEWRMLQLGWLSPCWPEARLAEGELVGTLARLAGLCWTAIVCRVVYKVDEAGRFGFAYGTLVGHLLHGEERFLVERDPADDSVWFEILAFSQPARLVARLGYPLVRWFQHRFTRDAPTALARALHGN